MYLAHVLLLAAACVTYTQAGKVICYWDGRSFHRQGAAKITIDDIKPGLTYCTHLVYGYAGIDEDSYVLKNLDPDLVLDKGKRQYRAVTELKRQYPGLLVSLAIGGFGENDDLEKYYKLAETESQRIGFVNSVRQILNEYDFDGIDLVWRFPDVKEQKEKGTLGTIWSGIKSVFKSTDDKVDQHRDQFVTLLRELKASITPKLVTLGVMPHINATAYYDVRNFINNVDFVNLWSFDFKTPKRSKKIADHAHPLYYAYDRNPSQNADAQVRWWLEHGTPPNKIILGIPTFGRSWELDSDSGKSGVPPLTADGAGDEGPYTKIDGTLAYYETCTRLVSPTNAKAPANLLRRVPDPNQRLGTYAFRLPYGDQDGYWISFEEPETARIKAAYAKQRGLGGVAIVDMSMDDPRGSCDGTKFPILRSAKINS